MPTLPQQNTTIYVEYGDVSKASASNPAAVFANSFSAVWHLDDALSSTAIADATGTRAGTATGLAAGNQVAAQLGGGISFDGSGGSQIAFTNPITGNAAHTITVWVSQHATTHTSTIVLVGDSMQDHARFLYGYAGNTNGTGVGVGQYTDDFYPANQDIENAGWTMLAWSCEGTNRRNHIYKNGAEITGSPHTTTNMANTSTTTGLIGFAPSAYGASNGMYGTLDELRIASVARDVTWIQTEYANQSSPSTFYTVGAEEIAP
jgi:hypothetical protein